MAAYFCKDCLRRMDSICSTTKDDCDICGDINLLENRFKVVYKALEECSRNHCTDCDGCAVDDALKQLEDLF